MQGRHLVGVLPGIGPISGISILLRDLGLDTTSRW